MMSSSTTASALPQIAGRPMRLDHGSGFGEFFRYHGWLSPGQPPVTGISLVLQSYLSLKCNAPSAAVVAQLSASLVSPAAATWVRLGLGACRTRFDLGDSALLAHKCCHRPLTSGRGRWQAQRQTRES